MRKVRTASRFVTSRTAALATGFVVFAGWLVFLQVAVDPPSEPLVVECKNNASVFDPSALPPLPAPRVHFVLVHAGKSQPPGHIYDCISHTRQLNPTRTVLVITDLPLADVQRLEHDEAATPGSLTFIRTPAEFAAWRLSLAGAASAPLPGVVNILIDAVPCSPEHLAMRRVERSQSNDRTSIEEGFWYNTLSRLFYVYDVVRAGGFTDVVHFEVRDRVLFMRSGLSLLPRERQFDNLIYFEYEEIAAPLREAHTSFTSVPLGRKNELANVVWIRSAPALEPLMAFLGRPDQVRRGVQAEPPSPACHVPPACSPRRRGAAR